MLEFAMSLLSPWRADFPALAAFSASGQTYLDSAATAQKPQTMLDSLLRYYAGGAANVHRAQHQPGEQATRAFEASREKLAQWFNAASAEQIIFSRSATEAFNLLAYALQQQFQAGDEIVISAAEHHANLLPWQQLALRQQLKLVILPLTPAGSVDLAQAASLISPRTRLLAVTQLSNVFGAWQPLPQLLALAKAQGALTVVDGAQGVVHQRPDVQALGCDFYLCSSHKLYGPDGVGILYGRPEALAKLAHWQFGGEMLERCDYHSAQFRPAPLGFEAGTPAIGSVIALGASLDYLASLDAVAVQQHEAALHQHLLSGLKQRPGVQVLGAPDAALVSFSVNDVHPADLGHLLSEQGIAVRAGQHCAMPLFNQLGLAGAVRVSLGLYNDGSDLERFFHALDQALELLR